MNEVKASGTQYNNMHNDVSSSKVRAMMYEHSKEKEGALNSMRKDCVDSNDIANE